jgi:hypothetical protein
VAARTNQRADNATGNCSSAEKDAGRDEEDPQPPAVVVTVSSARIDSDPDQEVLQEEATPDGIPFGWKEDPQPPAVMVSSSSARIGSDLDQEVLQEEATPDDIPLGWRPGFRLLDWGEGNDYSFMAAKNTTHLRRFQHNPRSM